MRFLSLRLGKVPNYFAAPAYVISWLFCLNSSMQTISPDQGFLSAENRLRTPLLGVLLMVAVAILPHKGDASSKPEVMRALVALQSENSKQSWEVCRQHAISAERCKFIQQVISRRERDVLVRISSTLSKPLINREQLAREAMGCYRPGKRPVYLVQCWEQTLDRYDEN